MAKPINENLRDVRVETEAGDLVPLLDHAGYELIRPDRAFKTAVQSALAQIKDATGFMILQGTLSGCAGS